MPPEEAGVDRARRLLGADFRIERRLGGGATSEVFAATDLRLGREVAVKVLRADVATPEFAARFMEEARAMARVHHPGILEIYDVGGGAEGPFFITPLVRGETLRERLDREGALPLGEAVRIVRAVGEALAGAHAHGVIHRDVKPANILVDEGGSVLLADFGIARVVEEDAGLTTAGSYVGTPLYMSPEQAVGDPVDHRSDLYALGAVAFEMITGRPPFTGRSTRSLLAQHLAAPPPDPRASRADCPAELAGTVLRCLAKDPGDRFDSAGELLGALEGSADAPPPPGERERPPRRDGADRALRRARRSVATWTAASLVLVALDLWVGLGGLSAWLVAVAVFAVALQAGALRRRGIDLRWAWRGAAPADRTAAAGRGRDGGARLDSLVRACGARRAAVLKLLEAYPAAERAKVAWARAEADRLMARAKRAASRVTSLEGRMAELSVDEDERQGEHARSGWRSAPRAPERAALLAEVGVARRREAGELREAVEGLDRLLVRLERGEADPAG